MNDNKEAGASKMIKHGFKAGDRVVSGNEVGTIVGVPDEKGRRLVIYDTFGSVDSCVSVYLRKDGCWQWEFSDQLEPLPYCEQQAKQDTGKPRLSLVPHQILFDISEVREYGIKKYGDPENWRQVDRQRYVDAMYRHWVEFLKDPQSIDSESGLHHYKHVACNMAFISELMKEENKNG